ncbi:MAG: hypothetical protein ABL995_06070 [Bryobacteraceae bacterium]
MERMEPVSPCAPKFWLWPNLLSLDAPVVAVLWQVLFLRCFRAPVEALPVALLALTVWLIYSADRALDAFAGDRHTPRHRFYREHWRMLAPMWVAGFAAAGWMSLTELPLPILRSGLMLLSAVGVYLFIVHSAPVWLRRWMGQTPLGRSWTKEAVVAVLFALGSSLGAWEKIRTSADVAAVTLFSALCWINCVAIERWECREWGAPDTEASGWPLRSIALGIAAAAVFVFLENRPVLATAEMASAFAFLWLDHARPRLSADALRVLADAALLSPIFLLPIAGHV